MNSILPIYSPPDFTTSQLSMAPGVKLKPAPKDGVAPHDYHGTSNYPEYIHIGNGQWILKHRNISYCPE